MKPSVRDFFEPAENGKVQCRLCQERTIRHVVDMLSHARQHRLLGANLDGMRNQGPAWARLS